MLHDWLSHPIAVEVQAWLAHTENIMFTCTSHQLDVLTSGFVGFGGLSGPFVIGQSSIT